MGGCAVVTSTDKASQEAWKMLAQGIQQDLIVEFDDAAIQVKATQLNKEKGIMFDDADTLHFKSEQYAAIKKSAISTLPAGEFEILKNYDALPLMFLRLRSTAALKALLAHPSVVKAHEERKERLMPQNSRP